MTKQTITTEIDIPDGYEFVRIGLPGKGDFICTIGERGENEAHQVEWDFSLGRQIIIRTIWQPPAWMRPGWIVSSRCYARWYWHKSEPVLLEDRYMHGDDFTCCVYANGKPTVGDFTPPPCDDWRTSKRRIGGAE